MTQEISIDDDIEEELTSDGLHKNGVERELIDDDAEIYNLFDPNEIVIAARNYSIDSIIRRISHHEIELNPDRKGSIWRVREKSRLIESLLLNIPLPGFYVATDRYDHWIVVDGLQRLTILKEFILDRGFRLKDLEFLSQFDGMVFDELPRNMQRRILETALDFFIIQPTTPRYITKIIFKRINTRGFSLTAQEIRHALYHGKSTELLKELSECDEFKLATNSSINDDHMADRECVLRYLAFTYRSPEDYKNKDLDGFLSETMESFNSMPDEELNHYRKSFKKAMLNCHAVFGKKAFRKQVRIDGDLFPISKALFETWSVALGKQTDANIELLKNADKFFQERFIELLNGKCLPSSIDMNKYGDLSFAKAIQQTADVKSVHFRFAAVQGLVEDILKDY